MLLQLMPNFIDNNLRLRLVHLVSHNSIYGPLATS